MTNETIKAIIGGLIRTALAGVFSWAVAKGVLTEDQAAQAPLFIAGLLIVGGLSVWNKWRAGKKIETALKLPLGSTIEDLKEALAEPTRRTEALR